MNYKLKIAILVVVVAVAALVLYFPNVQGLLSSGETVAEDTAAEEEAINDDAENAVFAPEDDPYMQVLDALEAGRPVLIKFYARW